MITQDLKSFHNRTVVIHFRDGEIATARLTCAAENCEDVMIDVLGTSCPGSYDGPVHCSYIVPAAEILSVTELPAHTDKATEDKATESGDTADFRAAA